ncbi:MAG: hypothetical protein AB1726_17135 [Planctomycetota bacterium]
MDAALAWARGPLFVFSLTFLVLGLLRHVLLTAREYARTVRRAGDRRIPYRQVLRATGRWLFPVRKIRDQVLFSATSILFHAAVLLAPAFLAGHIALWRRGLGLSWPAIPNALADVLAIVAVVTGIVLVVERLAARATRRLSRLQDYLLPLLVALPFASGFLAMHPALDPFPFEATLLVHVLSGNLVLILVPITKLSHAAMLPSVQLVSELGWKWPATAGSDVGRALGKEGAPV